MFGLIVGLSKNIGRNNMKRKKILALLMVAALCVGTVAGCGSKDTESSKSESSKNENSESSTGDSKDDLSPITFKYYNADGKNGNWENCLLYTSPSPRDETSSRMPSSA